MKKVCFPGERSRALLIRAFFVTEALVIGVSLFGTAGAETVPLKGCAAKTARIEQEITIAQRDQMATDHILGLRVALAKSRRCDDVELARDRAEKVAAKRRKVVERQQELDAARLRGDDSKITRARQKLDHAKEELDEALADQQS